MPEHSTTHPLGHTRTVVAADHALVAEDTHVTAPLHGWEAAEGAVLISPAMGAMGRGPGFTMAVATLGGGARLATRGHGRERVVYVLAGGLSVEGTGLTADSWAYLPAGERVEMAVAESARVLIFEKAYAASEGVAAPGLLHGHADDTPAEPFLGDPGARLQTLLPGDASFDLAVNRFSFDPGVALPLVESHHNEHGLFMQHGRGVYRLGAGPTESWYPVQAGDAIWMAPFCPQWFVAMGPEPATYLYCKNVNRDVMA
ncbi:(S)-ureidoglycine aminohydrolase [Phycisphaera mikurensis]|uniref:Cupin 2 conserved barrel domain-containing protein n=1 Tax=Phycisphaera mikurensis (strain NBRC 102666 / KCTC 22515 / FYK2301M01) TaxID=1142394 RepID=I0IIY4_PHYMF|nr:(S)-ureidoglycine aminohydrolase [Phycisphaera mikurensis]MBB6443069.1 (S)-ureidoglycine aminohydrolase [Phycisphaera mikurensis]BAM05222.1 hypothetical protein PSMK_30630 [Phycisphaera mikurensis NBRC 102666]